MKARWLTIKRSSGTNVKARLCTQRVSQIKHDSVSTSSLNSTILFSQFFTFIVILQDKSVVTYILVTFLMSWLHTHLFRIKVILMSNMISRCDYATMTLEMIRTGKYVKRCVNSLITDTQQKKQKLNLFIQMLGYQIRQY